MSLLKISLRDGGSDVGRARRADTGSASGGGCDDTGGEPSSLETVARASEAELRHMYAMALVRLVNGLADAGQRGEYARSVAALCEAMGLPDWMVDVRHDATHNDLPSLCVLRLAARRALWWLQHHYWAAHLSSVKTQRVQVWRLLRAFKKFQLRLMARAREESARHRLSGSELKRRRKELAATGKAGKRREAAAAGLRKAAAAVEAEESARARAAIDELARKRDLALANICTLVTPNAVGEMLVPLILRALDQTSASSTRSRSAAFSSEEWQEVAIATLPRLSGVAFELWTPALLHFSNRWPHFTTSFVSAMVRRLHQRGGTGARSAADGHLAAWVAHILAAADPSSGERLYSRLCDGGDLAFDSGAGDDMGRDDSHRTNAPALAFDLPVSSLLTLCVRLPTPSSLPFLPLLARLVELERVARQWEECGEDDGDDDVDNDVEQRADAAWERVRADAAQLSSHLVRLASSCPSVASSLTAAATPATASPAPMTLADFVAASGRLLARGAAEGDDEQEPSGGWKRCTPASGWIAPCPLGVLPMQDKPKLDLPTPDMVAARRRSASGRPSVTTDRPGQSLDAMETDDDDPAAVCDGSSRTDASAGATGMTSSTVAAQPAAPAPIPSAHSSSVAALFDVDLY